MTPEKRLLANHLGDRAQMSRTWSIFLAHCRLLVGAGVFVFSASDVSARTLEDVRKIYQTEIEKIDKEHKEALDKALKAYGGLLSQGTENARKAGDLDALLILQKERERFEREKTWDGQMGQQSLSFDGFIDEIMLFKRALKEDEINEIVDAAG